MDTLAGKVKMTQSADGAAIARRSRRHADPATARDVTVHYGTKQALFGISIDIPIAP